LRILFVTPMYERFHYGGVAISCSRISQGLASRGHDVRVLVLDVGEQYQIDQRPTACDLTESGVLVSFVPHGTYIYGNTGTMSDREFLQQGYFHIRRACRQAGPDVIVTFYLSPWGYPASIVSHELQLPLVAAIRGNDIGKCMWNSQRMPFVKHCLQHCTGAIFLAEDLQQLGHSLVGPIVKSRLIYNGIPKEILQRHWPTICELRSCGRKTRDCRRLQSGNGGRCLSARTQTIGSSDAWDRDVPLGSTPRDARRIPPI